MLLVSLSLISRRPTSVVACGSATRDSDDHPVPLAVAATSNFIVLDSLAAAYKIPTLTALRPFLVTCPPSY